MKKRTSALLLALVMIFSLMAPMANAAETPVTQEAVYLGLENFNEMNTKTGDESTFVHRFFIDGEVKTFTIGGEDENYPIQNQLMEGYIYNVTSEGTVVTDVELQDKGVITMGTVESVG